MTTTPSDKEQALPTFKTGGLIWRAYIDIKDQGVPMRVDHLAALLSALDPETRSRVLREAMPESDWARIDDEDDAASRRFLDMSDDEFDAEIVAAGGDPERHHRAAQAMGRWVRKLSELHVELTSARAEVERLKAELAKSCVSRPLRGDKKDTVVYLRDGTMVLAQRDEKRSPFLIVERQPVLYPAAEGALSALHSALMREEPKPKEPT